MADIIIMAESYLTKIGNALKQELTKRHTTAVPHHFVVKIAPDGLAWSSDPEFEIWPCSANPQAGWGIQTDLEKKEDFSVKFQYMDIEASERDPNFHERKPGDPVYPETTIHSNFAVRERFFIDYYRTDFAEIWDKLKNYKTVSISLTFFIDAEYDTYSTCGSGYVTFLTKFSQEAVRQGYRNLNEHLLNLKAPVFPFEN